MASKNKSTAKKIFDTFTSILIVIYVILVMFISISIFTSMKTGYPSLFGYSFFYVRTDSMEPEIYTGDLVVCHDKEDFYSLNEDRIIAFKAYEYVKNDAGEVEPVEIVKIHRIVGKDDTGTRYITKGDNVDQADVSPVAPSSVLGIYEGVRIAGIGKFFDFLQGQNGVLFFLVIPMAAFFIYALFKFVKAMIDYKLEKVTSGAPADGELTEEQKQAAIAEYLAKQAAEANKDENNTDNTSEE